jgi:hypothetical protein
MGQQQRRHQHRDDDRFRAVDGNVAGGAGDGKDERKDALKRNLQKLYESHDGDADAHGDQFGAGGDAPVTEERIAQGAFIRSL